ncbi:HicA toxin of bacterial toxin-antitoxin [Candidatus Gugararchaeum adminiculabundum]|nr:HicA toxin of bacterial toxin-antitoxin [Candidatus Gugararchaeum adminiculabundum]
MSKLPVLSGKKIIGALAKAGYAISRQKGSHVIRIRFVDEKKQIVVVPFHKEVDPGTLLSIIGQAGLTREQFIELL